MQLMTRLENLRKIQKEILNHEKGEENQPMKNDWKMYQRNSILGAFGAVLMMVGDLSLSVIPPNNNDSGLFVREYYLSGAYPSWRFPLLLGPGVIGIALCAFAVWVMYTQIKPEYKKLRLLMKISGVIYLTSACVIHYMIGSLADWTSMLSPLLERDQIIELVQNQYQRAMPCLWSAYVGMVVMILGSAWAFATKKTILPGKMFIFHILVWQNIFVLVPDIRQAMGADHATLDYVLSQSSGNTALCIYMIANAVWAGCQRKKES